MYGFAGWVCFTCDLGRFLKKKVLPGFARDCYDLLSLKTVLFQRQKIFSTQLAEKETHLGH